MIACPNCFSEAVMVIGSAYDDEEYRGDAWECMDCDHRFCVEDGTNETWDADNYSVKL